MENDQEQLRLYATTGSQDAFATLVQRFLPLVYRSALRHVHGDTHRAEDVAQMVFTALARSAAALSRHPDLTGWLFTTTRFLAAKTLRGERRRFAREQAAGRDAAAMSDGPASAPELPAGLLDDVLMELRQLDREVILLRFHRGLRLAEIGAQLGATDNAIQKRLDRALDLLREKLARRGITSTAAALAAAFEQQTAVAVPAGLTAVATGLGVACGTGAGGLLGISTLMAISKVHLSVAAAVVVATTTGFVWQASETSRLRVDLAQQNSAAIKLQDQLMAFSKRATEAEADAARLQKALQSAQIAADRPPARQVTDGQQEAQAELQRAGRLVAEGKLQEGTEAYLKLYATVEGARASLFRQMIVRALGDLGKRHPAATDALRELRDAAVLKIRADPSKAEAVSEATILNVRLGDKAANFALYDSLPVGSPGRQAIGAIAFDAFVEARRYSDALVGKTYGNMLRELEMHQRMMAGKDGMSAANYRTFVVKNSLDNLEALFGGSPEDAKALADRLLAFDNTEATQAAIAQRKLRATGNP